MKLTKQTINKLNKAPVTVRLVNGSYNIASVEVTNNKIRYEVFYELSHPLLECRSGVKNRAKMNPWIGHSATMEDIPEELEELKLKLKIAATMTDEYALEILKRYNNLIKEFVKQFYGEV